MDRDGDFTRADDAKVLVKYLNMMLLKELGKWRVEGKSNVRIKKRRWNGLPSSKGIEEDAEEESGLIVGLWSLDIRDGVMVRQMHSIAKVVDLRAACANMVLLCLITAPWTRGVLHFQERMRDVATLPCWQCGS